MMQERYFEDLVCFPVVSKNLQLSATVAIVGAVLS